VKTPLTPLFPPGNASHGQAPEIINGPVVTTAGTDRWVLDRRVPAAHRAAVWSPGRTRNVVLKYDTRASACMTESGPEDADGGVTHVETVRAHGHEHVTAAHGSTLEVTTDDWLTPAGDCILAIEADRSPAEFDEAFVAACRDTDARIEATIAVDPAGDWENTAYETTVTGYGHPDLTFTDDRGAVVRTSDHVDDRTVAVGADAAAADLDRGLVAALADGAPLRFTLRVREN
jgi:hypothetical protein